MSKLFELYVVFLKAGGLTSDGRIAASPQRRESSSLHSLLLPLY